jgi:PhnB protein
MTTMPKKRTIRAKKATARKTTRRASTAARGGVPFRTVTPYLAVSDATAAIDWYKRAFGAKELTRMPGPGGKIMHAEVMIGDSRVMLSDVFPGSDTGEPQTLGGTTSNMHIYHRDVDKLWRQAVAAGARVTMPLEDQFWGDRYGKLKDPFGHNWALSFKAKMTKEEMERKRQQAMAAMAGGTQP